MDKDTAKTEILRLLSSYIDSESVDELEVVTERIIEYFGELGIFNPEPDAIADQGISMAFQDDPEG